METNKLITIVIPAYNLPDYTKKTLSSIAEQTYRPLKVILLDDHSPTSLYSLAKNFENIFSSIGIDFLYIRNEKNLAGDIILKMHSFFGDGWGLIVHHDDWFIDPKFLESCMDFNDRNSNCEIQFFYANAITEISQDVLVDNQDQNWKVINGDQFVPYMLNKGFTAWASILFKNDILRKIKWPNNLFFTDRITAERLDLDADDAFSAFHLLAMYGNVAVTGAIVSIRGQPKSSYSQSSAWARAGNSLFYIYYNLYKYKTFGKYGKKVSKHSLMCAYYFGFQTAEKINKKLISHFDTWHMKCHYHIIFIASKIGINRWLSRCWVSLDSGNYLYGICQIIAIPMKLIIKFVICITPVKLAIYFLKFLQWYIYLLKIKINSKSG